MPGEALLWWLSALPTLILLPLALTAVALLVRAVLRGEDAAGDPRRARPPLGLLSRKPRAGRFPLGRHYGLHVSSNPESHLIVIGPTGSGKTSACLIPALLTHPGAAIVVSTKADIKRHTHLARRGVGEVLEWKPFDATGDAWDMLAGCRDLGRRVRALGGARARRAARHRLERRRVLGQPHRPRTRALPARRSRQQQAAERHLRLDREPARRRDPTHPRQRPRSPRRNARLRCSTCAPQASSAPTTARTSPSASSACSPPCAFPTSPVTSPPGSSRNDSPTANTRPRSTSPSPPTSSAARAPS